MELGELRTLVKSYEKSWSESLSSYFMDEDPTLSKLKVFLSVYKGQPDNYHLVSYDLYVLFKNDYLDSPSLLSRQLENLLNKDYLVDLSKYFYQYHCFNSNTFREVYNLSRDTREIILLTLKSLSEQKSLTDKNFNFIFQIMSDTELLALMKERRNFPMVLQLLTLFDKWNQLPRVTVWLKHLIRQDETRCSTTIHFFKSIDKLGLLSDEMINYVLFNDVDPLSKTLYILQQHSLIKHASTILLSIIKGNLPVNLFLNVLTYLSNKKLLDETLLMNAHAQMLNVIGHTDICIKHFTTLLNYFTIARLTPHKESISKILTLSAVNLERIVIITADLWRSKLLTEKSFQQALERVTMKLPPVLEVGIDSVGIREGEFVNRTLFAFDNKEKIYVEDAVFATGGYGALKKGYTAAAALSPRFVVKELMGGDEKQILNEAKKEVKFNRLLGHHAFFYRQNGKTTVIADWQQEKSLEACTVEELRRSKYESRIKCVSAALADLNVLHQHFRVHGDVKPGNIIIDLSKPTMRLIDFGGTHKLGSRKLHAHTEMYDDPYSGDNRFGADIYAMGIVIMCLFPEIFVVERALSRVGFRRINFTLNSMESAIVELVSVMTNANHRQRCSSKDALEYCKKILGNATRLSPDILFSIKNETITHSKITVEDVLREVRCDY